MSDFSSLSTISAFELFLLGAPEELVDHFFQHWPVNLIVRLRQLNTSIFLGVESYISRAWDIEKSLNRWFFRIPSFLATLDVCEGIVSGSEAQQHLDRHRCSGRDLDIYVPCHGLLRMGQWLRSEGYVFQPSGGKHILFDAAAVMFSASMSSGRDFGLRDVSGNPHPNSFSTFNFFRPQNETLRMLGMDGIRIQLIGVRGDPVQFLLYNFHSTGVMNYFTGTYAVSFFPRLTFLARKMLICQDMTRNLAMHQAWQIKYRRRGFVIIGAEDEVEQSIEARAWDRRVGDKFTWVLPHTRSGVTTGRKAPSLPSVRFEVLPAYCGVAAAGAALRIGPKFVYSAMAVMATGDDFGRIRTAEVDAAFADYAFDADV
ncbi:hypothetical protein FKP32DRAFT_1581879 [Trametes sanguinea]|nr:hypothetical protein FKP32DRAFT_1581879 [Trametes sanguinea]